MANKDIYLTTLALASVSQTALMTSQLAHQGCTPPEAFDASLQSLMIRQPESALSLINHDEQTIKVGLASLLCMLTNGSGKGATAEITRYTLSLLTLAQRLEKKHSVHQQLLTRLKDLERQCQFYPLNSPTLLAAIAAIYSDLISPLTPRIHVIGSQPLLQNPLIQNKVRAVLLTGLHAAQVWRQSGGSRLNLIFSRAKIVACCYTILSRLS